MRKELCIPYHIQRRKASRLGVIVIEAVSLHFAL
jgi:hypothetical protein